MSLDFAGKIIFPKLYLFFLLPCGGDGRWCGDNNRDPSVPRGVVYVVKNRLAEWQLTQHAHEERTRVRDAQVAKTDKTGSFKQTDWLDYFAIPHSTLGCLRQGRTAAAGGEADGAAGRGAG
jgi:hypothetical protein